MPVKNVGLSFWIESPALQHSSEGFLPPDSEASPSGSDEPQDPCEQQLLLVSMFPPFACVEHAKIACRPNPGQAS